MLLQVRDLPRSEEQARVKTARLDFLCAQQWTGPDKQCADEDEEQDDNDDLSDPATFVARRNATSRGANL